MGKGPCSRATQHDTSGGVLGCRGQRLGTLQPFCRWGAVPQLPFGIDSSPGVFWTSHVASPFIPLALDRHRTAQLPSCISRWKFIATLLNSISESPLSSSPCECSRSAVLAGSEQRFPEDAGHPERCGSSPLRTEAVTSGPAMQTARLLGCQAPAPGTEPRPSLLQDPPGTPLPSGIISVTKSRGTGERQGSPWAWKAQERSGEPSHV